MPIYTETESHYILVSIHVDIAEDFACSIEGTTFLTRTHLYNHEVVYTTTSFQKNDFSTVHY